MYCIGPSWPLNCGLCGISFLQVIYDCDSFTISTFDVVSVAVSFKLTKQWNTEYEDKASDSYKTLRENIETNIVSTSKFLNVSIEQFLKLMRSVRVFCFREIKFP